MSQRPSAIIRCACCERRGVIQARGLVKACYERHRMRGALGLFATRRPAHPWLPTGAKGRRILDRFRQLVAQGADRKRIRWELSLTDRQIQRYAAADRYLREQERAA